MTVSFAVATIDIGRFAVATSRLSLLRSVNVVRQGLVDNGKPPELELGVTVFRYRRFR